MDREQAIDIALDIIDAADSDLIEDGLGLELADVAEARAIIEGLK